MHEVEEAHNEMWIRVEDTRPQEVIKRHETLVADEELNPILEEKQIGAIAHHEEMLKECKERVLAACQSRWKELTLRFQAMEPHSPQGLQAALFRARLCKDTIRRMKLRYIGLKFSPPLLLPLPTVKYLDEEEKNKWKEEEQAAGYYTMGASTRIFA